MFDKLSTVESRYEELMARARHGGGAVRPGRYQKAAKALSELEPLVQKFREYKAVEQDIAGAEELAKGSDAEMRELAEEELTTLNARRERAAAGAEGPADPEGSQRREERHPRNPRRHRRRRGGAVRGDLFRMYTRYAERQGWKLEVMSTQREPAAAG